VPDVRQGFLLQHSSSTRAQIRCSRSTRPGKVAVPLQAMKASRIAARLSFLRWAELIGPEGAHETKALLCERGLCKARRPLSRRASARARTSALWANTSVGWSNAKDAFPASCAVIEKLALQDLLVQQGSAAWAGGPAADQPAPNDCDRPLSRNLISRVRRLSGSEQGRILHPEFHSQELLMFASGNCRASGAFAEHIQLLGDVHVALSRASRTTPL